MKDEKRQEGKFERLTGETFPWVERRKKAITLAQIYERAGYEDYAKRAGSCATWLEFLGMETGEKTLRSANFCQLRLCPMCTARRARYAAMKLSQVLDYVQAQENCRFIFLTLTVENCTGPNLGATLDVLTEGWNRFLQHRHTKRAILGWFRAIEITRNHEDGTFHPHIHAILAVPKSYFRPASPLYITQDEFKRRWKLAARLDYEPIVDIRITRKKKHHVARSAAASATLEAAKYATKDADYIDSSLGMDDAALIVTYYTEALHRKRLTAFGGVMKEVAARFKAGDLDNGDLIHADEDHIREDLADMILIYNWNLGVGDYILARKGANPMKAVVKRETKGPG